MFKNMKLGAKQIGGFVLISLIIAVVGAVGINGLRTTGKAFDVVMDQELPVADASMEAMISIISGRDLMGEFLLTEESASASEEMSAQAEQMKGFVEDLVVLVGGSGKGAKKTSSTVVVNAPKAVASRALAVLPKKELPAHQAKEVKPEQVIPMDDDFKDF